VGKSAKDKNENCLAGMRCPCCGALEPYEIGVAGFITVHDYGTGFYEDVEWTDDSSCRCLTCGHCAQVSDFQEAGVAR